MNSPSSSNYWNGRFIGDNQRYRIERPLAAGGMGEVLLATDTRVGQQVVLKLLKDTLVASAEMRKRFEREVAICAALQSDHIVKISDCGVTPEGYPFYVMEYLRGQTLRQLLLRERRLTVERTVRIISQVCQGLQMAHQGVTLQKDGAHEHIKVIHRDLKPDNIFLVPTDLGEWVKILDFGVAKIRSDSSEQTNLTNTFIGTFRYAAPEQIQNKQNLDARADIYSLGIILYEMLSAADPFGFSTKGSNISEASWVLAHAYEAPTPLRSQPGCEQLSPEIEAVVLKCLHKNPQNRFASVAELNQALQAASQSVSNNAILQPQKNQNPVHNQNFQQETVAKPLSQPQPTQPGYNQDVNNQTILKPLQPEVNQSLSHQGLDNETVPRSLQPTYLYTDEDNQQLNNETVDRSLQPSQEPEGTIFQPRLRTDSGNAETASCPLQPQPEPQEGTIFQVRPNLNETASRSQQSTQSEQAEGTIFQIRPQQSTQSEQAEGTIFQVRPQQSTQSEQPEETIFQVHHKNNLGNNQSLSRPLQGQIPPQEGTIMQSRPSYKPADNEPENTLYQPRRDVYEGGNNRPDNTIFQPRTNRLVHASSNNILGRNLWIALAVVAAFFAGMLIFYVQSISNLKNPQPTQNSIQK